MRRALSLLVALSGLLNGCTSWKTQEVAPATYVTSHHPDKIRLTLQDSTVLTLQLPTVVSDSIVGSVPSDSTRHAVAESDVRSFEVRTTSAGKTVGLLLGITAGAVAALAVATAISLDGCTSNCF